MAISATGLAMFVALTAGASTAAAHSLIAKCTWSGQTQPCSSTIWYPSTLKATWQTDDPPPDSSNCPFVEGPYSKDIVTTISCSATWNDSPSAVTLTPTYTLHVETSQPTVSGAPIRPPDSNGWYNHPLSIAFTGSAFSGIASCASFSYTGPNTTSTTLTGSCTDNAGKTVSATTSPFAYDVSPPSLVVGSSTGDQMVQLNWSSGAFAPMAGVELIRQPGLSGPGASVLYSGANTSFQDTQVRNRVRYQYTLIASDAAGNSTGRTVTATPSPHLLWPPGTARTNTAPLLLWTPVRHATYYNVQLYRGRTEVLSRWPSGSKLQLKSQWKFARRHYHLRPGKYQWFVWPGFRKRSAGRYGRLIGSATFTIFR